MAADPYATTVEPTGLRRALLGVAIFFTVPTTIVTILRCGVRLKHQVFGLDDALMLFGWMLYIAVSGIVARGTYSGIGAKDVDLNATMQSDGRRYLWFFQVTYCCSLLFIKGSICILLLRIAIEKTHRIILWTTLTFATLSTSVVIIGLFVICRPISTAWGHPGKCAPTVVITSLGYLVSAGALVTDWICAILPGFILYKTNMKMWTKISITVILGLGVLQMHSASIVVIVRLPYVKYYTRLDNYLYNVANIVIWSIVESGIGIIASSLPALRRLVKKGLKVDSTSGPSPVKITPYTGTNRATITSATASGSRRMQSGMDSTPAGDADWDHFDDASSSRNIYVQVDLEMQSIERPVMAKSSHRSLQEHGY
ncbi:hypothetical protein B0T10DRAFT_419268 [Thelonectria olida]|uniref:Rhodopsin domain-containing protein n=1 Tax=Thelonectria olida TaxID=1576542 RepID=A0A9P8VPN0_9HYPO|nr:hypothetical protein B0T10DRAFT_419268 [Thelonectria olida]